MKLLVSATPGRADGLRGSPASHDSSRVAAGQEMRSSQSRGQEEKQESMVLFKP